MKQYFDAIINLVVGSLIFIIGIEIFIEGKAYWHHYRILVDFEDTEIIFGPLLIILGSTIFIYGMCRIVKVVSDKT